MSAVETTLWTRCLVDELARHGVRDVVLAPGSRSTPLVLAFARDERFRLRVHLDERSVAFFALGVGRAGAGPAVVVTTSGTAVANLLPAVVEASMAAVPLLLLTADRPPRLRDADANQAIDQAHIFGRYPRRFFDTGLPVTTEAALRHLRGLAGRAVAAALGPTAGPVHVNLPFDKPLEPVEPASPPAGDTRLAVEGRPDGAPFVEIVSGRRSVTPEEVSAVVRQLAKPEGVIVAGPASEPSRTGPAVLELAARTGFPVLADPLSGARFGPDGGALRAAAYDLYLDDPAVAEALRPEVILRVGVAPTSASLLGWLDRHRGTPQIVVDGEGRWKDSGASAGTYVHADTADTLRAVAASAGRAGSEDWIGRWAAAEEAAGSVRDAAGPDHEAHVPASLCEALPAGAALVVSSSMPIRDLDAFAPGRAEPLDVFANRGASGIDGVVSTAHGIASRREGPVVCVLGDLAFFHDQNGLLWSREADASVVFVLIDNDGGGIFHMLPIADHEPHFTDFFATPHGLDFSHAAALQRLPFEDARPGDVAGAVLHAISRGGSAVVRVRTERVSAQAHRRAVRAAVRAAVAETLGRSP